MTMDDEINDTFICEVTSNGINSLKVVIPYTFCKWHGIKVGDKARLRLIDKKPKKE